jgi:hypothetical protein
VHWQAANTPILLRCRTIPHPLHRSSRATALLSKGSHLVRAARFMVFEAGAVACILCLGLLYPRAAALNQNHQHNDEQNPSDNLGNVN